MKNLQIKPNTNVFCYWENRFSEQMPDYLSLCHQSIKTHCSQNIDVYLVTPQNMKNYITDLPADFDDLGPAHKADYLRIRLLHDYGGAWFDIDTIVFESVDDNLIIPLQDYETISFRDFSQAVFSSRAGSSFLKKCLAEITTIIDSTAEKSKLRWSAIGADVLYPLADIYPRLKLEKKCVFRGYKHWEDFLEDGDRSIDGMFCCFLYNKFMFPRLRDISSEKIMGSNWLLANLLRKSLQN